MLYISNSIKERIKIVRVFSLFKKNFEYKYTFSGESHNFWECVYVNKGSINVSADGRIYKLKEGEIIFHKPLEFHKFFIDNEDGAELYIFSFVASGELTERIADTVCETNKFQKQVLNSLYNYLQDEYASIEDNEVLATEEYYKYIKLMEKNPLVSQMISTYICQLIISIAQNNNNKSSPICDLEAEIFRKSVEIMNDNVDNSLTIPELAHFLNSSESTLKRIFKKYADTSVHKYFLMTKINHATELLNNGMLASEVSEKLNFSSQAYFSACYKRETGENPSNIQKKKQQIM